MKILVTGSAGFIGFHLVNHLMLENVNILGIDNINDYYSVDLKYDRLCQLGIDRDTIIPGRRVYSQRSPKYSFIQMDIRDVTNVLNVFHDNSFDLVIHLAAQPGVRYSLENPQEYIDNNISGFLNILDACKSYRVPRIIYASSSSVYGLNKNQPFSTSQITDSPLNLYAVTKKTNELMAHAYGSLYGIETVGLRFFTVYGPWGRPDMAPYLFADAISCERSINVYNSGDMERDFTYVSDIVNGIVSLAIDSSELNSKSSIFNIGNGKPINLLRFIEILETEFGKKAKKNFMSMQPGDIKSTWASTFDFERITGTKAEVSLEEGVKEFVNWFKTYRGINVGED